MLGEQRVIAFVATTQPDAAEQFYRDTLGLTQASRDPFALVFDAGGTMLRVAIVEQFQPQPFTALGWIVADIDSTVRQLAERGVAFTRYEGMDQDALGIWRAPEGARIAWFKDPDGNTLSLTQL
jgi:catechol 2,3-dioxygenase-like lactoylglutathione lyase family enzyme